MSSIAPGTSQKLAAACEAKGVDFLDAPVSGGEPGAIAATLAIMVGGPREVFDRHHDLFAAVGGSIVLCGDYGAGNTTKLANQIIVAANIEAVGEALTLAKKAGLDPNTVSGGNSRRPRGQHCAERQGTHDDRRQLQPRVPRQAAPQGPEQRAHNRYRSWASAFPLPGSCSRC